MFKKVEAWVLYLAILLGIVSVIFTPSSLRRWLDTQILPLSKIMNGILDPYARFRSIRNRFEFHRGFQGSPSSKSRSGYHLLLSRFDADKGAFVVELINLQSGNVLHKWHYSRKKTWADFNQDRISKLGTLENPILHPDGSLVFVSDKLVKIDVCSRILWRAGAEQHHSVEVDADGNFWVPAFIFNKTLSLDVPFEKEDGFAEISPDGVLLQTESILKLLIDSDLRSWIPYNVMLLRDPIHLNDIQPVLADGPYWKKGDLFLSFAYINTVVLYRPSERKILWWTRDGLELQHDINILDDHRISIFDNNKWVTPPEEKSDPRSYSNFDANDVVIYDFRKNKYERPFREALRKNEVRTPTQGRGNILPNGNLFFEESDYGRLGEMTKEGEIIWEYVNRGSDGYLYQTSWSRVYTAEQSKKLLGFLPAHCEENKE